MSEKVVALRVSQIEENLIAYLINNKGLKNRTNVLREGLIALAGTHGFEQDTLEDMRRARSTRRQRGKTR